MCNVMYHQSLERQLSQLVSWQSAGNHAAQVQGKLCIMDEDGRTRSDTETAHRDL